METENMQQGRLISSVIPLPQKRLRLELCTGSVLELNMENRLNTMRYYPLRDEEVFQSVTTDGYTLLFRTHTDSVIDFNLREAVLLALNPPPYTYAGFNPFQKNTEAEE